MPPEIDAFDHVHVYAANRAAAEAWYRDVLGFVRTRELEFWAPDGGPLTLQNEQGTVHLALFERPRQACRSTVALRVGAAAFGRWRDHLNSVLNGAVTMQDHEVSLSLYFADPDGNPFEITTYDYAMAKAATS